MKLWNDETMIGCVNNNQKQSAKILVLQINVY